ncbi:MAG: DUF4890 domain-containing protein [Candidatus Symbiothrix sp.]|jgi:Spy/CpxP family protein refolding chaperone|nr:DUF4890 domain-containing protein [Candidatus Symbiothrix sp.]
MKAILRTGMFFLLVSLFTINVSAQKSHSHKKLSAEERAVKQTERMTEQLGLTEEQQVKVKALNLKYAEQLESQRKVDKEKAVKKSKEEGVKKSKEGVKKCKEGVKKSEEGVKKNKEGNEQRKALREAKNAELKEILTPEQLEKLKTLRHKKPHLVK